VTQSSDQHQIRVVPANEATWDDLQAILAGEGRGCQCQYFKLTDSEWHGGVDVATRADRLRQQTKCGDPTAVSSSGLVAYCDGVPAGWCAVEPRHHYPRLLKTRVPWAGRSEDKADDRVWAVTCFVVRKDYRRRGIARALALHAVGFARERGARAVEGYPRLTADGQETGDMSLYVGSREIFAVAGYREVSRPTPRRPVMRVDLWSQVSH
jgi:ribosomal protein S18 acetylase RimI-like enzyme